jgi:putative ABC transport system ATP-binding protein
MNHYTVYENVEMPLLIRNYSKKERKRFVFQELERMGISDLANKLPIHISGGQQQRCAIARALVTGSNLILADEPTGALDSKTSGEIMTVLKEINELGKTIVVVTHDEKVASQAKRIIRIEYVKIE